MKTHYYNIRILWTGNNGTGTSTYDAYSRNHNLIVNGKPVIPVSSDTIFRGDAKRHNPEDLLVASLSSCHMLWYLHLCADEKIVVTEYSDDASGLLEIQNDGSGRFTGVMLKPTVKVKEDWMLETAHKLHEKAHKMCFIANSCNFPVEHKAVCKSD